MKKRILLLIPCLLLALGLLTACGGNGSQSSDEDAENKLTSSKWSATIDEASEFNGILNLESSFLGEILDINFEDNGTGYISILGNSDHALNFNWYIKDNKIQLKIGKIGYIPFELDFSMNNSSITLKGTGLFEKVSLELNRR